MDTRKRIEVYTRQNGASRLTHRQRRRVIKKAGADPTAIVIRDDGMGYAPNKQGFRELVGIQRQPGPVPAPPVSGAPAY